MSRRVNPVPGRRGWHLGRPITSDRETRCSLTHVDTGFAIWVWGNTPERRVERAQNVIDHVHARRLAQLAELIEAGDQHGPNVWLVGYTSGRDGGTAEA